MDEVKKVKIVVTDTTRKLSAGKGQVTADICNILDNREPHFVYTDEDGDRITAFSEQEMEDAIFKDNITILEWKGTGGASQGEILALRIRISRKIPLLQAWPQVKSERQPMRTATMMCRSILNNSKRCRKM